MNALRTTVLLAGLTVLLVLVGGALGGRGGMVIALIFAAAMNFGSYWFSDRLVLKMHGAREASPADAPELYNVVRELAQRAQLPMPRVFVMESDTPNAFATGRNPSHAAVAATTGLLRMMNREELRGVLAHELAHVRHRDTLISAVAATFAGAITMIANMAQWAMLFGGFRGNDNRDGAGGMLGALATIILAPLAAALIQMAVSRSREFAADKGGAEISGNPMGLASALRKLEQANQAHPMASAEHNPGTAHLFIVNPLAGVNIGKLFSTHPPTAERIQRLEAMSGRARM
ncbi:zinc metalloprotease HtpX [Salinisphaera hydrothermalis]|uniref:Protease HtpX n=1 Tax=Salinisphaera hydrothermalis (strain C41B8) TaxID=1304275 RepID=A0A084INH1_SALHC|nr:zinc metalloprotease HtpX [Salinisphaera hydrothermalis]KEZ78255.1 HtpX-2 peptidase [Salinisphaera hydrothermalis C41B8]